MASIGARIRLARVTAQKTQQRLADAVGVSVQAVSQWETQKTTPDIERLHIIAANLRVSPDWLMGLVGDDLIVDDRAYSTKRRPTVSLIKKDDAVRWMFYGQLDLINEAGAPIEAVQPVDEIVPTRDIIGEGVCLRWPDENLGFSIEDLLIFDTGIEPLVGDIVLGIALGAGVGEAAMGKVSEVATPGPKRKAAFQRNLPYIVYLASAGMPSMLSHAVLVERRELRLHRGSIQT